MKDRRLKILWKQYSFKRGTKLSLESPLRVDPVQLIDDSFKVAIIFVKYLLEKHQFEGLKRVVNVLKNKGIRNIEIRYHKKTDTVIGRRNGKKIKILSQEDKRNEESKRLSRVKALEELNALPGVKLVWKSSWENHKREICVSNTELNKRLTIQCDRDFSDLGNVETEGVNGVTFTYIVVRMGRNASVETKELLLGLGWREGFYVNVAPNQSSIPVSLLFGNETIKKFGDTMKITLVHFRKQTHMDALKEIIDVPCFKDTIKLIQIATVSRGAKYKWTQLKKEGPLTKEAAEELKFKEEKDDIRFQELKKRFSGGDSPIKFDIVRHDTRREFHENYIEFPNADPHTRYICDEGLQFYWENDENVPTLSKLTRSFSLITQFFNDEERREHCPIHDELTSTQINTKAIYVGVPGDSIGCQHCALP